VFQLARDVAQHPTFHAEREVAIGAVFRERVPDFGARWLDTFICQPPITKLDVFLACCDRISCSGLGNHGFSNGRLQLWHLWRSPAVSRSGTLPRWLDSWWLSTTYVRTGTPTAIGTMARSKSMWYFRARCSCGRMIRMFAKDAEGMMNWRDIMRDKRLQAYRCY